MISIQSILLVALGFLTAGLVVLAIAPAFWSRAVRLTTKRLKAALPVSEEEIRADKDRLRAEFAIRTHKLEMRVEQAELVRARHLIDISRRDANVSALQIKVEALGSSVEEHQNARLVLEQTIADRLPRVEQRLSEAKTLLFNRDREIAELTQSTQGQSLALEEATAINAQQAAEVERMTNALTARGARNQGAMNDPKYEAELALRSEIEALRAKTREQVALITRLQSAVKAPVPVAAYADPAAAGGQRGKALGTAGDAVDGARAALEREISGLKAQAEAKNNEIVRLKAELMTVKADAEIGGGIKNSRIALQARLAAAESDIAQHSQIVQTLRAELAAANERNTLQAQQFMDETRRLGAGTLPAAGQHNLPAGGVVRRSLAERVAQNRTGPQIVGDDATNTAADQPAAAARNGNGHGTEVVHLPAAATGDIKPARPRLFDRIQTLGKT